MWFKMVLADNHSTDDRLPCTTGCVLVTSTDLLLFPDRKSGYWKGLRACRPSKMKLGKCSKSVGEIRLRNIMHCRCSWHHLLCLIGMMNHTSQLLRYILKIITWNKLVYPCHNIVDGQCCTVYQPDGKTALVSSIHLGEGSGVIS